MYNGKNGKGHRELIGERQFSLELNKKQDL